MAGHKEMWEELNSKSSEELRQNIAIGHYSESRSKIAKAILEEREISDRKEEFSKMLKATQTNAKATWYLFLATVALVIATALLVYFSK